MYELPLHPAVAHLPLGIAMVAPLVALGLTLAFFRGLLPQRAFAVLAGLQLVLVGSGLVSLQLGEEEEEHVERLVDERHIEAHEEAAQLFVVAAGATLLAAGALLFLRQQRPIRAAAVIVTLLTIAVAGLGVRAGGKGGELVYRWGAASAHLPPGTPPPAGGQPAPRDDEHVHDGD